MIPEAFEYFAPSSIQEAISLARRYGGDAKFLSGGHSLLPMMKLRLAAPKYIIDLAGIGELTQISEEGDSLKIGALVTHKAIETSDEIQSRCRLLAEAAFEIGDPQVRSCGTIGGSVAHADPAADYPAALLALDAEVRIEGPSGGRSVRASDFFVDLFTTALQQGELLVAIHVPVLAHNVGTAYKKLRQQASGFALVSAAAVVAKDEGGKCTHIAVGISGVGPKAFRASKVEESLLGKTLTEKNITNASHHVTASVDVQNDIHASAEYRSAMADLFAKNAIWVAANRAE
ncbi:MAG: xanthine dehydrogenase family protein subunit M [Acidobacteria bacterium]|nr:xanthine dehydrogenase family protein subunit M [Acidobacteriota bacterium]